MTSKCTKGHRSTSKCTVKIEPNSHCVSQPALDIENRLCVVTDSDSIEVQRSRKLEGN